MVDVAEHFGVTTRAELDGMLTILYGTDETGDAKLATLYPPKRP